MLARWSIRNKLLFCVAMFILIVAMLSFSSFRGVYAYRELARTISYQRASELRLAAELSYRVGELRAIISHARPSGFLSIPVDQQELRESFRSNLLTVGESLSAYTDQLRNSEIEQGMPPGSETQLPEWHTVQDIQQALDDIAKLNADADWVFNEVQVSDLDAALADLHQSTLELPVHLHQRMSQLAGDVRGQYRIWIIMSWVSSLLSAAILILLVVFFVKNIFGPLRTLIQGSRRIAGKRDFDYRIHLKTHDEVAELAEAMNAMTDQFQNIQADLAQQIRERDEQVKQRTKELIWSEKLASVGLLAAGVAHEINNPLAAIAWAAESLEMRVHDTIVADDAMPDDEHNEDIAILKNLLRDIQDEAFRCKGITDQLLDFSRMGDMERQETDLHELVQAVIDMVRHLGKYREKQIRFDCEKSLHSSVNAQEIKQVVLNLITNALDSLHPGGTVDIHLVQQGPWAELIVQDNGCGMTDDVKQHLFEPFFTRRRDGQGTGLGLSISYRIIQDHGGEIIPSSEGPGCGSEFRVTLPLIADHEEEREERLQAA